MRRSSLFPDGLVINSRLILLLLLFIAWILGPLLAAEEKTVEEIGQAACWVGPNERGQVKVASFNDQSTYLLSGDLLNDISRSLNQLIKKYGQTLPADNLELFVHCGGHGSALNINHHGPDYGLCSWVQLRDGKVKISHIGINPNNEIGPCDGMVLGRLLLTAGPAAGDPHEFIKVFHKAPWVDYLRESTVIGKSVIKLILKDQYYFKEKQIRAELLNDFLETGEIKTVEYESFYHSIGEYKKLDIITATSE